MVIDELGKALAAGTSVQHRGMLTRIADLFVAGIDSYTEEQVNLFDEVIARLASGVEPAGRVALAVRLATLPKAPSGVMRLLAFDDDIEVAGPVLRGCELLDEADLLANANIKGEAHLAAIAARKALSAQITDVLIKRGDHNVVHVLARNAGARFSDEGFGLLVLRSCGDDRLSMVVGKRKDLPRQHYQQLIERASSAVRERLPAANPTITAVIGGVLSEFGNALRGASPRVSVQYGPAAAEPAKTKSTGRQRPSGLRAAPVVAPEADDLRWWPAEELALV
jgi:uncharacterized protein (DUF2336 family)